MPLFAGKMKKSRKKAFFPLAKGTLFLYKSLRRAEVAQLVEQGTENPRVGSSILSLGTIFISKECIMARNAQKGAPGFLVKRKPPARLGVPENL